MKERLASQQIEAVFSSNWKAFEMWQGQSHAARTLDMSQVAAQALIPRRILELSEGPNNVHALLTESSPNSIGVLIFERLPRALTDPKRFNKWTEEHKTQKVIMLPSSQEDSPEGVDYKHIRHKSLLESGELTIKDRVFIYYVANIPDSRPGVVFTKYYGDRKELQRKGIASSFYERLEMVLRQLEFKYLIGDIVSSHPQFFERQRIRYSELPDVIKNELPEDLNNSHAEFLPHNVLVKIL